MYVAVCTNHNVVCNTSHYSLFIIFYLRQITPVCTLKAIKNEVEAKGMVDCHIVDGIALCKYFAWLEDAVQKGEYVDEITGATKLEEFRK